MYTVNVSRVRGKMGEKGYSVTSLSSAIGVNRNTLANYLEHPSIIPYGKLAAMASLLCDGPAECAEIFFARKLT